MITFPYKKPDIIIADDHLIFRQGLKSLLMNEEFANVIAEASNGNDLIELLSNYKPDLILMDIDMPYMNGLEATRKALEIMPGLKIIAFTMHEEESYYYKMIDFGAMGFILKTSGIIELGKAIQTVMQGDSYFSNDLLRKIINNLSRKNTNLIAENVILTIRELEVLQEICLGLNNEAISEKLFISPKTVKSHRSNLLGKTACKNTPELILFALKNKIVDF